MTGFTSWTREGRNDVIGHGSCVRAPKSGGLLGGLTGFSIQLYSRLRFIIAKRYKAKPAKGKGT